MNNVPFLQRLVDKEPWRRGFGRPRNALDPTWEPGPRDALCDGEVDWEGGTRWWVCQKCGYVSDLFTNKHRPIQHPFEFLLESISFFQAKRKGIDPRVALEQMAFIAGTALRYAAVARNFREYVVHLVTE